LYNDQRPGAPSLHTDGLNAPDSPWPGDDGGSSYAGNKIMPSRGDSTAFPIRSVKHHRPDRKAYRGGPQRVETSENSREDPPLSGTRAAK
ncbi:hypothetical protein KGM_204076B, partial [Danaus plexippus plexippus]